MKHPMAGPVNVESGEAEDLAISPEDSDSFIEPKLIVRRYNGNVLAQCLGNDLAVKRIVMMAGQPEHAEGMIGRVRQDANSQIIHGFPQDHRRKRQLAGSSFDRYLRNGDCAQLKCIIQVSSATQSFRALTKLFREFHCVDDGRGIQQQAHDSL